jgi:hypothetical protein
VGKIYPEKGLYDGNGTSAPGRDIEDGHLVELEVDLSRVIAEEEEKEGDWDADTSPFAAVRAVVPETDDPEMPVNTFRAWFLGIVRVRARAQDVLGPSLTAPIAHS